MRMMFRWLLLMGVVVQAHATKPLSDQEMRTLTEADTKPLLVVQTLQCPPDMSKAACDKLSAMQALKEDQNQAAYQQALNNQTQAASAAPNPVGRQPAMSDVAPPPPALMNSGQMLQQLQQGIQQIGALGK